MTDVEYSQTQPRLFDVEIDTPTALLQTYEGERLSSRWGGIYV